MNASAVTLNSAQNRDCDRHDSLELLRATRTRDARQMQIGFKLLW